MFTKYFNNGETEYVIDEQQVVVDEDVDEQVDEDVDQDVDVDQDQDVDDEAEEQVDEDELDEEKLQSKLNYYDEDEDKKDRLYIISIDNIPHLYAKDLKELRTKMWEIANVLLKSSKNESDGYYIFTNNLNEIKIICPYDFFILKYHHVLYELKIDYVLNHTSYFPKIK